MKEYLRRDDAKWSHPETAEAYKATLARASDSYDPSMSLEDRKANVDAVKKMFDAVPSFDDDVVEVEAPGCPEEPDATVPVYYIRPDGTEKKRLPCLFVIPGGGLTICMAEMAINDALASQFGAVTVTLKYREIYEGDCNYYPKQINDCHAAYQWVVEHADELCIDPDRIVLYGGSTGGQLVLALAHRLKRYDWCGGSMPRGVVSNIPVLDCRDNTPSQRYTGLGWEGVTTQYLGQVWLEGRGESVEHPAEAFPAFAKLEDCYGMPPVFIHTGDCDPAVDPDFDYASKLIQAGVFCEVHCWGGENHGSLTNTMDADVASRYKTVLNGEIEDCFEYDFRRQWLTDEE
jgi:acetyl esterase/lipase